MQRDLAQPLVTILTPVYNGARFLRECIESVLAQDYGNWEYVIVDNCSTDETLAIAQSYAARDARIRVTTNAEFLTMPQNFNNAFRMVSPRSAYCKVVCADDWIYPQCLGKLVRLAQAHPSVGIVTGYQRSGGEVRWAVLPPTIEVLSGREACRMTLLQSIAVLPGPTAALYRADLLRGKPFFPNDQPHADTSACFEHLSEADLGIVHEVLSEERLHEDQITTRISNLYAGDLALIEAMLVYGPRYLGADEHAARLDRVMDDYYACLGRAALRLRVGSVWRFQRRRLAELGLSLDRRRVAMSVLQVVRDSVRRCVGTRRNAGPVIRLP
jgi:glycosyltransferase involved in cell wall biosynthesis